MKKWIALILALVCALGVCACRAREEASFEETGVFFVAKVVEINGETLLVEVTDKGNCGVGVGDLVVVSAEKLAGVLANDLSAVIEHYVRIEFDGTVMESYPLQLGKIFKIDITDKDGESYE